MAAFTASASDTPSGAPPSGRDPAGVDVWLTFLDDVGPDLAERYRGLLSPGERARFERYRVEGARREFLVGRALLRTTLSRYRDVPPDAWSFAMNAHGRPDIAGPIAADDGLTFNLSHTRGLVALAVSHRADLGVDVEASDRDSALADLSVRYFAEAEVAAVRAVAQDEAALRETFFAFWTLKEAYIKARGMGLALPLGGFAFELRPDAPTIAFSPACPDDAGRWRFLRRTVSDEHRLALAVSPPERIAALRMLRTVPLTERVVAFEAPQAQQAKQAMRTAAP